MTVFMFTSSNSTHTETLHYAITDSKPQTMQIYDTNFSQKSDHFHGPIWETTHIYRNAPVH